MTQALAAALAAFLLALVAGPATIRFLRSRRLGKGIRAEGPESHAVKAGTPTMGGILILGPALAATVALEPQPRAVLVPLLTLVGNGALGVVDDLGSLVGSQNGGLSVRVKFGLLLALALAVSLLLYSVLQVQELYLPFAGKVGIGPWYVPIAALTIVAGANAVNLTDGLDGLAGGTAAMAFIAYGVIAFLQGQSALATFCFALVGALLGFLWYNAHPAQLFMGDTGALALGSTLGVVALMTGHWLLLPVIGIIFVVETLSVIIQVAYFKITGGRRIFRMSPLHHHFELVGWTETQVTARFWLVGAAAALAGIALAIAW